MMGYYAENPYERPENPRCQECDECMTEKHVPFGPNDWECRNVDCPECPERRVMDSLEQLVDEVPPEPDTIGAAVGALCGQADLSEAEAQERENQAILDWLEAPVKRQSTAQDVWKDLGASTNEMRDMADL